MTTENSIVSTQLVQDVNSISMVLLTMSEHYELPEPLRLLIQDVNDIAESLSSSSSINEHIHNLKVVS